MGVWESVGEGECGRVSVEWNQMSVNGRACEICLKSVH